MRTLEPYPAVTRDGRLPLPRAAPGANRLAPCDSNARKTFDDRWLAQGPGPAGVGQAARNQKGDVERIKAMAVPLVESIDALLHRGRADGVFRDGIDAVQLDVSIVAQSQIHISNRHTVSILFDRDLDDSEWLAQRRAHAESLIMDYVTLRDGA